MGRLEEGEEAYLAAVPRMEARALASGAESWQLPSALWSSSLGGRELFFCPSSYFLLEEQPLTTSPSLRVHRVVTRVCSHLLFLPYLPDLSNVHRTLGSLLPSRAQS